jgi:hypothetical protein
MKSKYDKIFAKVKKNKEEKEKKFLESVIKVVRPQTEHEERIRKKIFNKIFPELIIIKEKLHEISKHIEVRIFEGLTSLLAGGFLMSIDFNIKILREKEFLVISNDIEEDLGTKPIHISLKIEVGSYDSKGKINENDLKLVMTTSSGGKGQYEMFRQQFFQGNNKNCLKSCFERLIETLMRDDWIIVEV